MADEGVPGRRELHCTILGILTKRKPTLCEQLYDEPNSKELLDQIFGDGYVARATKLTDYVLEHRT
jgi:hypothetical protein